MVNAKRLLSDAEMLQALENNPDLREFARTRILPDLRRMCFEYDVLRSCRIPVEAVQYKEIWKCPVCGKPLSHDASYYCGNCGQAIKLI